MVHVDPVERREQFEFRGNAREYFGIWIVNLLLSIVTIGIYSAWAKVRTKKYFYQNTYVAGRNFDYHATGMQILIGRIIIVVALVIIGVLTAHPIGAVIFLFVWLFAVPLLLVRSFQFNARMSSWSNVRFSFIGEYGGAFAAYILYPFFALLTLYTAFPFADRAMRRFQTNNHMLGKTPFAFSSKIGPFYVAALAAISWIILACIVAVGLFIATGTSLPDPSALEQNTDPMAAIMPVLLIYGFMFFAMLPAATLYRAMTRNTVYNNTTLGGVHQFKSNVPPLGFLWLAITNLIAIVCTLGLLLPWAKVRMSHYLADHTALEVHGSLDEFVNGLQSDANALGDAYTDIEGIDVGLAI